MPTAKIQSAGWQHVASRWFGVEDVEESFWRMGGYIEARCTGIRVEAEWPWANVARPGGSELGQQAGFTGNH